MKWIFPPKAIFASLVMLILIVFVSGRPASAQSQFSVSQATSFEKQGDWTDCVNYAQNWTQQAPDEAGGWEFLGICEGLGLKNAPASISAFRQFLQLQPNEYHAWNALGIEYHSINDNANAAAAFKRATDLAPQHPNYWNNLAAVQSEMGEWGDVADDLDHDLAEAAPNGTWHDWYVLGNGYANIGEYEKAATAYQHAEALNPQSGNVWNNLGVVAQDMGETQAALNDYKQADTLGNNFGGSNYNKLIALMQSAQHRSGPGGGSYSSGGSSGGGGGSSGGGCGYNSYEACNAAAAGEFWSADRLDAGTASGSEEDFYSGD